MAIIVQRCQGGNISVRSFAVFESKRKFRMKTIYGRVLVKESNAGVSNLVVAACDSERGIQNISAVPVTDNASAPLTERLGKRIGSVLTGQDGTFTFSFDDAHFTGNDVRPDLLIVVFAPEDTQGPTNPYPLPAEQRVLYISRTPRADAGSEESYIIRLLQAQLDNFSISAPSTSSSVKSAEITNANFAAAIESSYISREQLKTTSRSAVTSRAGQRHSV